MTRSRRALSREVFPSTPLNDALSALHTHAIDAQEQDLKPRPGRVQQDRRRRGRDRDARRHQVRGADPGQGHGPLGRRVRHHRLRGRDEGRLRQLGHRQRRAGFDGLRGLLRRLRGRARVGHGRAGHRQVGQKGRRGDDADRDGLPASRHVFLGRARPRLRAAGRHRQGMLSVSRRRRAADTHSSVTTQAFKVTLTVGDGVATSDFDAGSDADMG